MKVGVIQSNYIPWRGYFDFIASVDLFVFHDDLQYTKGDWRNRNRIKTANGLKWLTVPVKYLKTAQLIEETAIDYTEQWQKTHINQFIGSYSKASYFNTVLDLLIEAFSFNDHTISQLNIRLIRLLCSYLGISTELRLSNELALTGNKTERLIGLLVKVGATTYLSGPAASSYLDETAFKKAGIGLSYKTYNYGSYPQLWNGFEGGVSVIDLIANCGKASSTHITSQSVDVVAVHPEE